jgi:DNA-binding response OmpR family regulator
LIGEETVSKRILIVDDDREFLDELRQTLELSGYELIAVDDADLALDVARKVRPAAVLLDLKMPKKSGFQLADELRHLSELADVPIIAMSAFYKQNHQGLLDMCGIKKCLVKPFQPLDVIAEIEEALLRNKK